MTVPTPRRSDAREPGILGWLAILFVVYFIVDTLFRLDDESPAPPSPAVADRQGD